MVSDLERLTEALTDYENAVHKSEVVWDQKSLVAAARAYRDLLANGVEPDYEAAIDVYVNQRPGVGPVTDRK